MGLNIFGERVRKRLKRQGIGILEEQKSLQQCERKEFTAEEAGRAVIQYAAEVLKVPSLFAGRHPANDASGRVLVKLGFERTGEEYYGPTKLLHHTYHLSI
jgi:hypothetical protein